VGVGEGPAGSAEGRGAGEPVVPGSPGRRLEEASSPGRRSGFGAVSISVLNEHSHFLSIQPWRGVWLAMITPVGNQPVIGCCKATPRSFTAEERAPQSWVPGQGHPGGAAKPRPGLLSPRAVLLITGSCSPLIKSVTAPSQMERMTLGGCRCYETGKTGPEARWQRLGVSRPHQARQNFKRQVEQQGPASVPGLTGREWAPFRILVKSNPTRALDSPGISKHPTAFPCSLG